MDPKYTFGMVCVAALVIIQGIAFIAGSNHQVLSFTTTAIGSLIAFLLGLNLPSPAEKKAIAEFRNTVIEVINKAKP